MNTCSHRLWRILAFLLLAPALLPAQTSSWIAPGPYLSADYDPTLGYVVYVYAPAGSWSSGANWDTGVPPAGPAAVAELRGFPIGLYGLGSTNYPGATDVVIDSGAVTVGEVRFHTGSGPTNVIPQLTIGTAATPASLTLTGAGVTWQNDLPGNYLSNPNVYVRNGTIEFANQAVALGTISAYVPDGHIVFRGQSSAANATIVGGTMDFYDQSTAGQANLTSYGGITFHDHATFGNATLAPSLGTLATFKDFSSAGSLYLVRTDSAGPPWPGTSIVFEDDATAAHATIEVTDLTFSGRATAGTAVLRVTGRNVNESHGYFFAYVATLGFSGEATAAQATIVNNEVGTVTFGDDSTAGAALIANTGMLTFRDRASLGDAYVGASAGSIVTGNLTEVDQWGEPHGVPQYAKTGRITFRDQATGGTARIDILSPDAVLDLSGLATTSGATGRALLPAGPAAAAVVPDDAGTIAFDSITNKVSGGTIYLGGTRLQLGSGNRDMSLDALITDTGGAFGSLAGAPLAGGGLTKLGTGTLTIANPANHYTGTTIIQEGLLNLKNGRISATTIAVGAGLTGTGTVAGDLANAGWVAPGNSPGTITVQGNFTQTVGTLDMEIASPTAYDRLMVSGTATLGGHLTLSAPAGLAWVGNSSVDLLTAHAVSGSFNDIRLAPSLSGTLGAALSAQVTYSATGVGFQVTQLPLAGFGTGSRAAAALGAHLDASLATATGDYRTQLAILDRLPTAAEVAEALAALAPDRYSVLAENSFAAATAQRAALDRRLAEWRRLPAEGLEVFFEAGARSAVFSAVAGLPEARSRLDHGTAGGVWHHGGFDLGATLTSETGHADLDTLGSSARIRSLAPTLFAQYDFERLFLSASANYSGDDYRLRRRIVYAGNDQTAVADPSGSRLDFIVNAGSRFTADSWELTPEAGFAASKFNLDDFTESGAPGADLTLTHWTNRSFRSHLGFEAARSLGRFTPRLSVLWHHEFTEGRSFAAGFTSDSGGSYVVPGRRADNDNLQAALSLDARLGKMVAGYISLGGDWGRSSRTTTDMSAGMRWEF